MPEFSLSRCPVEREVIFDRTRLIPLKTITITIRCFRFLQGVADKQRDREKQRVSLEFYVSVSTVNRFVR